MKTAMMAVNQNAVHARAHAAENHDVGHHVQHRHQAGDGQQAVVRVIDGAATGVGGDGGKQSRIDHAKSNFFALHVAAGLRGGSGALNPHLREIGISGLLESVTDEDAGQEHHGKGGEYGPALARVLHHFSEGVSQGRRDHQQHPHFEQVSKWRRIFERMGGVGIEEASAVGAQFLDGFLGGHRSLRDDLLGAFHGGHGGVGLQILNHALRAQKQSADERYRQQHVQGRAGHVHPEIAQGPHFMARESPDHGNRDRQARRGRYEVLHRQGGHLHEIAERGFSAVGLPVGVRQKARRRC